MSTTTMKRKAKKQGKELRKRALRTGDVITSRAEEAAGTVRTRAGDLGRRAAEQTQGARRSVGYWIAGEEPPKRRTGGVLLAGAAGAAVAFFLDPVSGRRRRGVARDWIAARFSRRSPAGPAFPGSDRESYSTPTT